MSATSDTPALVDRLFRTQAGRLVSHFTRRFGPAHLDLAEEVVQEALVKALQQWPWSGVPGNPAGWLFRVACNDALDILRRRRRFGGRAAEIARALERDRASAAPEPAPPGDDELRVVFICCHPALARAAQVALSLKTVGGLSVPEIARALLADRRAIAQRLVRAKRRIRALGLAFELPAGAALATRVDAVLDVIYLLFNEGYGTHAGDNLVRADLCREALRLGRLVAGAGETAVATPRAHALVALMALQAARLPARIDARGELVLLDDQDRSLWDAELVALGFAHLEASMAGSRQSAFHLQAAIAATHAAAADAAATDWPAILDLYDELVVIDPSPVARLNRAVAVARVAGPRVGLRVLDGLRREPGLRRYYLLPAVRADLLAQTGQAAAARRAYRQALARPCSAPERRFLERRLHRPSVIVTSEVI
jgi:RNA polymerase sigma-70 factor (ECF subfamily)